MAHALIEAQPDGDHGVSQDVPFVSHPRCDSGAPRASVAPDIVE